MKTILKFIGGIFALALLVFIFAGLLSPKDFEGEVSETLASPPQEVWNTIATPEQRKSRLPIGKITSKDHNELGLLKWTEQRHGGASASYEILNSSQPFTLTIALMASSQKLTGLWTYTLGSNDGVQTVLTIHEKSRLNDFTSRSLNLLKGRNSDLRAELRSIKRALGNTHGAAPAADTESPPETATTSATESTASGNTN